MADTFDRQRLLAAYQRARDLLLAECRAVGDEPAHWYGELSTSALSTATAVMAIQQVRQAGRTADDYGLNADFAALIRGGLNWLAAHQNEDGGWGDTVKSISNISTTMLAHAVYHATATADDEAYRETVAKAQQYIDDAGGVPAVINRYGKDKTFSVPILTHCALAGVVDWHEVTQLPFELACVPARFYAAVKMPVVSYALPALIAIGQVRHHFLSTWNPITLLLRKLAIKPSLRVLERIQPPNGGFLEAAPLTSFVTMSLAGMGLVDHVVVRRSLSFLCESARPDGSWPIDTNLATWTTTLAINALKGDVPEELVDGLATWLLDQQYKQTHPYTNAAPGGWAWTNLPGGVPDADDTPGAMLALLQLQANAERCRKARLNPHSPAMKSDSESKPPAERCRPLSPEDDLLARATDGFGGEGRAEGAQDAPLRGDGQAEQHGTWSGLQEAQQHAVRWLLDLQNRDGGFPTFCRGWGTLPFDRSSADITAHCLRAIAAGKESFRWQVLDWLEDGADVVRSGIKASGLSESQLSHAIESGLTFLKKAQRSDGSWLPLWFGNQYGHDDGNPVYGTTRVLMAYRDLELLDQPEAQRAAAWLASVQQGIGADRTECGATVAATAAKSDRQTPRPSPLASGPYPGSRPSALGPQPSAGWGGDAGITPSVEETALAAEVLLDFQQFRTNALNGIHWLIERVEDGSVCEPCPIGFYFARLWYFEKLYPLIFAVSALRRAIEVTADQHGGA